MEHDQPIGRLAGDDFEWLAGVVGTEEEDPVLVDWIARDYVRYGVKDVILGESYRESSPRYRTT